MRVVVTDSLEDLRYKVGAAIEHDRNLDFQMDGQGASLAVESVHRVRITNQLGGLLVRFFVPNDFRLETLEIPAGEGQAQASIYPKQN